MTISLAIKCQALYAMNISIQRMRQIVIVLRAHSLLFSWSLFLIFSNLSHHRSSWFPFSLCLFSLFFFTHKQHYSIFLLGRLDIFTSRITVFDFPSLLICTCVFFLDFLSDIYFYYLLFLLIFVGLVAGLRLSFFLSFLSFSSFISKTPSSPYN